MGKGKRPSISLFAFLQATFSVVSIQAFQMPTTCRTMSTVVSYRETYPQHPCFSQQRYNSHICMEPGIIQVEELSDQDTFCSYINCMKEIVENQRVVKKCSLDECKPVQEYLFSSQSLLSLPDISVDGFKDRLRDQKRQFLEETGFSEEQYEYLVRCLAYLGDRCAKIQQIAPALIAWKKMRESGMKPRERFVSTYMYVLSLDESNVQACFETATFHDVLFEPTEKSIFLRIKTLISQSDAKTAEYILSSLPDRQGKSSEWKKLRTFLPILSHYCDVGDMISALNLFRKMRKSEGVIFDSETYGLLIGALARRGYFIPGGLSVDGASTLGSLEMGGPALFDTISTEMAEDLLELSLDAAETILDGFVSGFAGENSYEFECVTDKCINVSPLLTIGRVTVNETSAVCPATGANLRLFALTEEQRISVHDTLLEMAAVQHEDFSEKLKARNQNFKGRGDSERARRNLFEFSEWLREHEGEPFTAIVDGANVAYAGHGNVHYSQVQLVVDKLEDMGEKVLVVMPSKYVGEKFYVAGIDSVQQLSEREVGIMNGLLDEGKMYQVPAACLDDYYWMLASVANQTEHQLHVSIDNRQGRFPGLRPMLVTNDQMRDHKLALLEKRLFRRWTSCHIVNYDLESYSENEWQDRDVRFVPTDFFSREIQGNELGGERSSTVWHYPVTGWEGSDRLCINIRR